MILETVTSEGLAHLSYVVGDESAGTCVVIDPRRDVDVYLKTARKHSMRVTHVLETHIHADFVSGSRELAAQTGAVICASANGEYGFEHQPLTERDAVTVGALSLRVLEAPGHTPEHICFLVSGGKGSAEPWAVFTGDTLFAGEVGRPDLLGHGTEERLAGQLYHTLHEKLLSLGDEVAVYPAHGKGSPCGGSIGDRNSTTIGYERLHNPRLQIEGEDTFVEQLLSSLPPAPSYYSRLKRVNAAGPPIIGCLPSVEPLAPVSFREIMEAPYTIVVDTREIEAFGGAHIAGALNIPLREEFPVWAGWMLEPGKRILLVLGDDAHLALVQPHLFRIGQDEVAGYLRQGMRGWIEAGLPFERIPQMSVHELNQRVAEGNGELQILDVRRDDEWQQGRIANARHIYVAQLQEHLTSLDRSSPVVTYCGSGYRASIAASLLQRNGFSDVYNVPGSIKAWKAAGYPLEREEGRHQK